MSRSFLIQLLKLFLVFCFGLILFKNFILTTKELDIQKSQNLSEIELKKSEDSQKNLTTQNVKKTQETIAIQDVLERIKVLESKVTQTIKQIETIEALDDKKAQETKPTQNWEPVETNEAQDIVKYPETKDMGNKEPVEANTTKDAHEHLEIKETQTIEPVETKEAKDVMKVQEPKTIEDQENKKTLNMFEDRKNQVQNYCISIRNPPKMVSSYPQQLLVLKERQLVWCPVYKAGTSTWMTYLAQLSTKPNKSQLVKKYHAIELGHKVAPKLQMTSWKSWLDQIHKEHHQEIRFIIVRHPFERLVSAFRDKLERSCSG